jgi:hypothetical protein
MDQAPISFEKSMELEVFLNPKSLFSELDQKFLIQKDKKKIGTKGCFIKLRIGKHQV